MTTAAMPIAPRTEISLLDTIRRLGPTFAERAVQHDADDSFVLENYADLRGARIFAAGVPAELGGGGANHWELSMMLRELAHYCSSTALALSMHTHQVAIPAWRWARDPQPALENFERRRQDENGGVIDAAPLHLAGSLDVDDEHDVLT